MKIDIRRCDPESGQESRIVSYQVPVLEEERWTIQDALEYILRELDPTLTFYRHSLCNQGICGRCALKLDGKVVLACSAVLGREAATLEPIGPKVIRDLVVESALERGPSD